MGKASEDTKRFIQEASKRIFTKSSDGIQEYSQGQQYWRNEPNIVLDRYSLKNLFWSMDWVYIVVNLIATKISNQHLAIFREQIIDGKVIDLPALDHELQATLDRPNLRTDQATLIYNQVADFTLGGNGLLWHKSNSDELFNVPFERIMPFLDHETGELMEYLISDSLEGYKNHDSVVRFTPKEILHAKKPNPSDPIWGLSPFYAGKSALIFSQYSQEFLNSFYLKGATPQLALELDVDVNEKGALRLLRSFEKSYHGRENARRPIVSPKGVKVKPLTASLADQQLITYINSNRETIINLFAIPKHELSIQDGGGLGSQEMRLSLRNFWLTTLKPTMRFIEGVFNLHFADRLEPNYKIKFDLSNIEALQDDELKKAELADRLIKSGVMSPNEARAKIFRMGPKDGGDDLQVLQGRGRQEEPPPVIPEGERPSDNEPIRSLGEKRKELIPKMIKAREEIEDLPRKSMEQLAIDFYGKYFEILIPIIEQELKPMIGVETRTVKEALKPAVIEHILRKVDRRLTLKIGDRKNEFGERYVDITFPVAEAGNQAALNTGLEPEESAKVRAIQTPESRRNFLKSRGIETYDKISASTTDSILVDVKQGLINNESLTDITRTLSRRFVEGSEYRAQRIARTEVGTATMIGREAAWRDTKKVFPKANKFWITANDSRVRDGRNSSGNHAILDSKPANDEGVWRLDNGETIRFPMDPRVSPEERINCRCDIIFETGE